MRRSSVLLLATLVLVASQLIAVVPVNGATVTITVNIAYTGFDPVTFSANQSDTVVLTVKNADTFANYHGFELKDPDGVVRFDLLQVSGYSNGLPQGASYTFTFTADKAGTWTFRCNLSCAGHPNLQAGTVTVKPKPGQAWIKTSLHLTSQTSSASRKVVLVAQIDDVNYSAVPGALVHFYRDSTWGLAELGIATSNSTGSATLAYTPPASGSITFRANFTGSWDYLPTISNTVTIYYIAPQDVEGFFPNSWGQNVMVDVRIVGVPALTGLLWIGLVLAVVSSVWATYAYVFRQILGIWKQGSGKPAKYLRPPTPSGKPATQPSKQEVPWIESIVPSTQQTLLRQLPYPAAVIIGLGMAALGFADFSALMLFAPRLSLFLLSPLALVEALVVYRLLSSVGGRSTGRGS